MMLIGFRRLYELPLTAGSVHSTTYEADTEAETNDGRDNVRVA